MYQGPSWRTVVSSLVVSRWFRIVAVYTVLMASVDATCTYIPIFFLLLSSFAPIGCVNMMFLPTGQAGSGQHYQGPYVCRNNDLDIHRTFRYQIILPRIMVDDALAIHGSWPLRTTIWWRTSSLKPSSVCSVVTSKLVEEVCGDRKQCASAKRTSLAPV